MRTLATLALLVPGLLAVGFLEPALVPESVIIAASKAADPVGSKAADPAICVDKKLQQCKFGFNWYLNITDQADWQNPDTLIYLIKGMYDKGVDSVLKLCTARTMFQQCLGAAYDSCLIPTKFLNQGVSLQNANKYIGIMRELEFQCNGGLLQTVSKWDCLIGIEKRADETYQVCKKAFENATATDPSVTCRASVDFTNCARAPYYIACGADASWWECERVRVSLNLDKQCLTNVCGFHNFLVSSPHDKYMEHGEKLARTQHVADSKVAFIAQHARHMEAKIDGQ